MYGSEQKNEMCLVIFCDVFMLYIAREVHSFDEHGYCVLTQVPYEASFL
jgi:hypothetical protein